MKKMAVLLAAAALALGGCAGAQGASGSTGGVSGSSKAQVSSASPGNVAASSSSAPSVGPSSSASTGSAIAETGSASSASKTDSAPMQSGSDPASAKAVTLQANGVTLQMTLADTEAASEFAALLRDGPISVPLHAYGGFEKVGKLPQSLPASDVQTTTAPGDVMLYQGKQISVFYGSNTWAYTPLGKIEGATAESLLEALGEGDVTVELSV